MKKQTLKKWLQNIGTMLLSTFVMLLICELVVRFFFAQELAPVKFMYDKDIGLIHVPHLKGSEYFPGVYDFDFSNGENGFRTTTKNPIPDFVNKKVMLIGDSFTYGKGVNDEETFAYRLQESLLKDSFEIINAGVEGRGTDYSLRAYQLYKDEYQPNTVIYFAHYNDLADNIREGYFEVVNDSTLTPKTFENFTGGKKEMLRKSKLYNWLISHSHFFALIKKVLVQKLMSGQVIRYEDGIDMEKAIRKLDVKEAMKSEEGRKLLFNEVVAGKLSQKQITAVKDADKKPQSAKTP